jgi:putative hydrolase of the HAD superfamily
LWGRGRGEAELNKPMSDVKAVIFDLDDTLYDRNAAQIQIVKVMIQQLPHVFHSHETERVVAAFLESDRLAVVDFNAGIPSEGLREKRSRSFLRLLGINEDYADTVTENYLRNYQKINIPITGAVQLVKELSAGFRLGVITNGLPDVQYQKIEAIGLRDVFSCIVLSEEIGIRKPDPRIFHHAANALQIQPVNCLYVGDSYRNDVIGAKSAGMRACWYNPGLSTPENTDKEADFTITSLGDLTRILGK